MQTKHKKCVNVTMMVCTVRATCQPGPPYTTAISKPNTNHSTCVHVVQKSDASVARDEVELPAGWVWEEDWQIDLNRAVDEEGRWRPLYAINRGVWFVLFTVYFNALRESKPHCSPLPHTHACSCFKLMWGLLTGEGLRHLGTEFTETACCSLPQTQILI